MIQYYTRSGHEVAEEQVRRTKQEYIEGKRAGRLPADRVNSMTLPQFCRWSGEYTYRLVDKEMPKRMAQLARLMESRKGDKDDKAKR